VGYPGNCGEKLEDEKTENSVGKKRLGERKEEKKAKKRRQKQPG